MTTYIILEASGENWYEVGRIEASGPKTAIRALLNGKQPEATQFAAVPERSWHPLTVTAETKTQLRFS